MTNDNYLMHYGVLGMKWGIRRYQPYPAGKEGRFLGGPKDPQKRAAGMQKVYEKSSKKLDRYYRANIKRQAQADKAFAKAAKRDASFFSNQKGVRRAMLKAQRKQRRANAAAYKGSKWYAAMEKNLNDISAEDVRKGKYLAEQFANATAEMKRVSSTQAVRYRAGRGL